MNRLRTIMPPKLREDGTTGFYRMSAASVDTQNKAAHRQRLTEGGGRSYKGRSTLTVTSTGSTSPWLPPHRFTCILSRGHSAQLTMLRQRTSQQPEFCLPRHPVLTAVCVCSASLGQFTLILKYPAVVLASLYAYRHDNSSMRLFRNCKCRAITDS
jgi:hypothetical protein